MVFLLSLLSKIQSTKSVRHFVQHQQIGPRSSKTAPRLLVDVSVVAQFDARTGIQRVVRALLLQLVSTPPQGYVVCPIYASRKHGYRYAKIETRQENGHQEVEIIQLDEKVAVARGDVFLGLDLAAHLVPRHMLTLLRWKMSGVSMNFLVYDVLPILHPEWFNPKTSKIFRRWIQAIAILADRLICISRDCESRLRQILREQYELDQEIETKVFYLGADIASSMPSAGFSETLKPVFDALSQATTLLMVGTIEPRKGYEQVLNAFEKLWQKDAPVNLVIVGKPGWKTEALQARLQAHIAQGARLWWFDQASDELLERLYQRADGLIAASYAEGFGLPVVEAFYFGLPVLCRDTPIFREVVGDHASFFSGNCADALAENIEAWLQSMVNVGKNTVKIQPLSWRESSQQLLACLDMAVK